MWIMREKRGRDAGARERGGGRIKGERKAKETKERRAGEREREAYRTSVAG